MDSGRIDMTPAEPPDQASQVVSVPVSAPMPPPASYRAESSTSTHRPTIELKADEASQATKTAHNGVPSSPASSPGSSPMKPKHLSNDCTSPASDEGRWRSGVGIRRSCRSSLVAADETTEESCVQDPRTEHDTHHPGDVGMSAVLLGLK
jgi:hypothetical protein